MHALHSLRTVFLCSLSLSASGCFGVDWDGDDEDPRPIRRSTRGAARESRTFYVRPTGDDASSGDSPEQSWRSLARVNTEDLEPGDSVLFEAGARFSGTLELDEADSGTEAAPVTIGTFGAGHATLAAGNGHGVALSNAAGIVIEGLRLIGDWDAEAQSGNDGAGIHALGTISGERIRGLRLRALEISGFKQAGIGMYAQPSDDSRHSGYESVEITDCSVHDNGDVGVVTDGPFNYDTGYSHADIRISGLRVFDNRGLRGKGSHTGSGIVLADVEDAVVEYSVAHDNGEYNDHTQGGGFGIWTWDARAVTIQHNESYKNRSQTADGGGFDLDGGVTDSVVQYNYSHDNAGAGLGIFQFTGARPFSNNLVQYNVSQNDGFGVLVYDGNGDMGAWTLAHNVTFGTTPSFATWSAVPDGGVFNNVLQSSGEVLVDVYQGDGLTLQGNAYWSAESPFHVRWDSGGEAVDFTDFASYHDATEQERFEGRDTGLNEDPQLRAAGSAGTLDDPQRLAGLRMYQLAAGSPLIDHGVDPEQFAARVADRDFFGQVSPRGAARDIGVHEAR